MSKEAMKLALDALEGWGKGFPDNWGDLDTEAVASTAVPHGWPLPVRHRQWR